MAQKSLFNVPKRATRKTDQELLQGRGVRKQVTTTEYVSGDTYRDAVIRAKSISERILGAVLKDLELVTDMERIREYGDTVIENGKAALDTETYGLNAVDDNVAGVCFYTPGEKGIYIPVNHLSHMTRNPLKLNVSTKELAEEIQEWVDNGVKFIFHHAKFDMKFMKFGIGVDVGDPEWCTLLGSELLNENERHSLKILHNKYVVGGDEDKELAKFNSLFKGVPFYFIPPDVAYMYGAYDPIMTWELYEFQKKYLTIGTPENKQSGLEGVAKLFHEVELPMVRVLFDIECTGVCIDFDKVDELRELFTDKMNAASKVVQQEIALYNSELEELKQTDYQSYSKLGSNSDGSINVNIDSPTQLAIILYDVMKLTSPDKKSPRGTGADILEAMDNPVANAIKQYRVYSKLVSTYLNLDQKVSPRDKRIHTTYKQNGARTGRMSSEEPNLQNIPARGEGRVIRQVFIPTPGYLFIGSDYSQQEPRSLASLSGDAAMIKAYAEDKDLYAVVGSVLYKMNYEDCLEFYPDGSPNKEGKARRSNVKSVLLGLMYGRGPKAIAEQMKVSVKEAEKVITQFFTDFPKVAQYIIYVQEHAREHGYVETALKRKRRLPDMQLNKYDVKPSGEGNHEGFNAFDFSGESQDDLDYVPDEVFERFYIEMDRAWGYKKKQEVKDQAKAEGYIITDNSGFIAEAERQCLNSVIQGTAADMTKLAMLRVHYDKEFNDLGARLLLQIHDELIAEAPIENAKRASIRLTEIMNEAAAEVIDVKMKCDPVILDRWEGNEIEL